MKNKENERYMEQDRVCGWEMGDFMILKHLHKNFKFNKIETIN